MISTIFYTNGLGCARSTNPLTVNKSVLCTAIECLALGILGGCIGYFFHPDYTAYIGIGVCSAGILGDISLFFFVNRQNLFFGGLPPQKKLNVGKDKYEVETVVVQIDNEKCYFYGAFLNPAYLEWKNSDSKTDFQGFINAKIASEQNFKSDLINNKLRVLTAAEREQTRVHFKDGKLMQLGLDHEKSEIEVMAPGEYIFVLQKVNDKKELFVAKKELTKKGRIQHSSFFHHDTIKSAGLVTIDHNGHITKMEMHSGHFMPKRENIPIIEKFIKEKLGSAHLNFEIDVPAGILR